MSLLRAGKIRPQIQQIMPLKDAARAHELMEASSVMGKLLLKP